MEAIMVQATPMDAGGEDYGIECSICGPVHIVDGGEARHACTEHMTVHGATNVVGDVEETDDTEFSD